jgi:hypothetical protein
MRKGWKAIGLGVAGSEMVPVFVGGLIKLWVQHYEKLRQEAKLRLPLRPVYFLALDE